MVIYSIILAGLELVSDDYFFHLSGMFGFEKDVTTNDLLTDGQAWGRSKVKPRTLVLSGYVRSRDVSKLWVLNQALAPNVLKTMVINGQYVGQVEVTGRGGTDSDDNIVTVQLTMPDPYWYAQTAKSVQLGATYSNGVVFGPWKNLLNPAVGSVTSNGVTCTVAADGTITLNGTATAASNIQISPVLLGGGNYSQVVFPYSTGTTYTVSCQTISGSQAGNGTRLIFRGPTVGDVILTQYTGNFPYTITSTSDDTINSVQLYAYSGNAYDNFKLHIQVERGNVATAWVPYNSGPGVTFGPRNAIQNGNFLKDTNSDGIPDGFVLSNASSLSLAGGEFVFKATAQYGSCSYGTALTPGHRYFIRANVLAYSSAVKLQATKGSGSYQNVLHPGDGTYHTLDFVVDIPAGFASATCYVQDGSASGWANIGVKDFRAVDMGTASVPTPDYALPADQMAAKYPNYQQEYGGVVFGASTGGAATLTNDGNADAYPVIIVVGTCSGISVTNLTTGETIAVNVALGDADELVIDCRPATCGVYLNGVPNIGLKTSPGWMRCVPGDNQITFSRNSLQNKKHCTVELNERWI